MSSFLCSIWWFVLGVFVGWLLSWWLSRNCCKKSAGHDAKLHEEKPAPQTEPLKTEAPASKVQSLAAMPEPAVAAAPKPVIKPAPKPAAKAVAKPTVKPSAKPVAKTMGFDKAAALLAGIKVKGLDDLEVIEGIGPKISGLLKADGVTDFAALAKASQTTLQGILDKAGARYKLAKPGTWPEQAKLAAAGKWAELKALQDSLSGGKR